MTPPGAATARPAPGHVRRTTRPRPQAVPGTRGRRVSGPAARSATAPRRAPVVARGSTLLDRLIHGRIWIVIIAVALVGLVFLQVSLLKLNSGIGRAVQTAATLERQNAGLRAEVSTLDSAERIQGAADRLGLVMPAAGDRRYLRAGGPEYAGQAARGLSAPAPVVQEPLAPDPVTGLPATPQVAGTSLPPTTEQPPVPDAVTPSPATAAAPTQTQAAAPVTAAPPPAPDAATATGAVSAPATSAAAPG